MSRVLDGKWRVGDDEVSALLIVFSFNGALLSSLCPGEADAKTPEVDILRSKTLEVFYTLSATNGHQPGEIQSCADVRQAAPGP